MFSFELTRLPFLTYMECPFCLIADADSMLIWPPLPAGLLLVHMKASQSDHLIYYTYHGLCAKYILQTVCGKRVFLVVIIGRVVVILHVNVAPSGISTSHIQVSMLKSPFLGGASHI